MAWPTRIFFNASSKAAGFHGRWETQETSLQSSKTWHLPSRWFIEEVVCWKLMASEICQLLEDLYSPIVEHINVMVSVHWQDCLLCIFLPRTLSCSWAHLFKKHTLICPHLRCPSCRSPKWRWVSSASNQRQLVGPFPCFCLTTCGIGCCGACETIPTRYWMPLKSFIPIPSITFKALICKIRP